MMRNKKHLFLIMGVLADTAFLNQIKNRKWSNILQSTLSFCINNSTFDGRVTQ